MLSGGRLAARSEWQGTRRLAEHTASVVLGGRSVPLTHWSCLCTVKSSRGSGSLQLEPIPVVLSVTAVGMSNLEL